MMCARCIVDGCTYNPTDASCSHSCVVQTTKRKSRSLGLVHLDRPSCLVGLEPSQDTFVTMVVGEPQQSVMTMGNLLVLVS
jgi:hypothetical protein